MYLEIIEIPYEKTSQYFLLLANYLDDFKESNLDILSLYLHAANMDKINFPRYLFFSYLDNLDFSILKSLTIKTNNKLVKIITLKFFFIILLKI